jgi:hypothetical protein
VISINRDNPTHIHVGDSYRDLGATITGPTDADKNLGIKTYLNGALVSNIVLDTTGVATDTIDYGATDLPFGEGRVSGEVIDMRTRSIRRGSGHGTSERWFG